MTPDEQRQWIVNNCVTQDADYEETLSLAIGSVGTLPQYVIVYDKATPFHHDWTAEKKKEYLLNYFASTNPDPTEKKWVLGMMNILPDTDVNTVYNIMVR